MCHLCLLANKLILRTTCRYWPITVVHENVILFLVVFINIYNEQLGPHHYLIYFVKCNHIFYRTSVAASKEQMIGWTLPEVSPQTPAVWKSAKTVQKLQEMTQLCCMERYNNCSYFIHCITRFTLPLSLS